MFTVTNTVQIRFAYSKSQSRQVVQREQKTENLNSLGKFKEKSVAVSKESDKINQILKV